MSLTEIAKRLNVFQHKTEIEYMTYENAIHLLNESEVWKQILQQ